MEICLFIHSESKITLQLFAQDHLARAQQVFGRLSLPERQLLIPHLALEKKETSSKMLFLHIVSFSTQTSSFFCNVFLLLLAKNARRGDRNAKIPEIFLRKNVFSSMKNLLQGQKVLNNVRFVLADGKFAVSSENFRKNTQT